tara:strand:- start:69 stop:581 length:513 start_codon:yes stop_codon:yes gene_type:complete
MFLFSRIRKKIENRKRLKYISSAVLGLNDALVELMGVLAGLTLALREVKLIAMTALITGIAASLSMAASEYLATKAEGNHRNPFKAATYTGLAYLITIIILILPYLFFNNVYFCLFFSIILAIFIIFIFNFYISTIKKISLQRRFTEMLVVSLGVAFISFIIGYLVKSIL